MVFYWILNSPRYCVFLLLVSFFIENRGFMHVLSFPKAPFFFTSNTLMGENCMEGVKFLIIHVVQPGDTLWRIAQQYGGDVQAIIAANGLNAVPYLIVGQSLVIPVTTIRYTVQPGDSLWLISQKYGVTIREILTVNTLINPDLIYPGTVLRIPLRTDQYGMTEVNGYAIPTATGGAWILTGTGPYLTYVSIFSSAVTETGELLPIRDAELITAANTFRVAPLLVITNYKDGNFNAELAHTILSDETVQQTLIANLLQTLRTKGYYGVNIDFERIPPEDRQLYNNFLRNVVTALHAENFIVSSALAPKPRDITVGEWHGAHDYRAHGEIVDFVVIMTYDWGWAGGAPYPIAPIPKVREVLDYAVSVIPRNKIMMGIPFYGYDWTLPYVPGGPWARMLSYTQAIQLAAQTGAVIQYNTEWQAPFFEYFDFAGQQHTVWFEDARSVKAKYDLVREYGLQGSSYWVLNLPFPQNWPVLDFLFQIRKVV